MDLSGYTAESAAVLKTALSTAKTIYANAALSVNDQATVDKAAEALNEALNGLVKLSGGDTDGDGKEEPQIPQTGENQTGRIALGLPVFRQRHSSLAPEKGRQIGNRNGKENTNGSSIKPPPVIE